MYQRHLVKGPPSFCVAGTMDVVNGKIVSARTERSRSDIWSALKSSRGSVMQPGSGGLIMSGPLAPPTRSALTNHGGFGATPSMAPELGTARWHRWPRDNNILGQLHRQYSVAPFGAGSPLSPGSAAAIDHPVHGPFEAGWKRSSTAVTGQDHYNSTPCTTTSDSSVALFDELEMAISYEPQVSPQGVCGHFDSLAPADEGLEIHAVSESAMQALEMRNGTNSPKRRVIMELESGTDQDGIITWIAPLRYLLRKELTVTDVRELGRIVLPKKDAEGKLPQIETKGKLLEMAEYSFSKRWFFRYKCWTNNKSQMYVLENTREFIKYHGLKARDSFIVYKDGCGNLVVCGKKKSTPSLDSAV